MTDEEILTLTSGPDTREAGFRYLVIKYQQRLYQVVRRQVPTHEDANDILQNTFIKIFRHLAGFEGRAGLYTWMYRIAINETNNHHKARERRKEVSLEANDVRVAEPYLHADDLSSVLEAIVNRLPDRQQMVFKMRYYDELSYKEMAEMLQLTEGALKASFHHAVRKIEEELKANQIV